MKVRAIQKEDNLKIAKVIREVFISDNYPKTGTAFADVQLDFLFENYNKPKTIYLVIAEKDSVFGGCGIAALDNCDENICELQKMYLLQEARGKGFAKELMEVCLRKAVEFNYEKCYIETLPEMESAQKLYLSYGFNYLDEPLGNTGHSSCPIWMIKNL